MSIETSAADTAEVAVPPPSDSRVLPARAKVPPALRADAPAWTWIGLATAGAGFLLLAFGWGQVAGEKLVYRQLPYLASCALPGVALVMTGVAIINATARHRDARERDRQIDQLVSLLDEVRARLTGDEDQ
jgi:hypothetical protein